MHLFSLAFLNLKKMDRPQGVPYETVFLGFLTIEKASFGWSGVAYQIFFKGMGDYKATIETSAKRWSIAKYADEVCAKHVYVLNELAQGGPH